MRFLLCTLVALLLPLSGKEWVDSKTEQRRTGGSSIGLSGVSFRHINTSVLLGKLCFQAVTTGVHREPIFPGEAGLLGNGLLSKFRLTIDEPGNKVIFENLARR